MATNFTVIFRDVTLYIVFRYTTGLETRLFIALVSQWSGIKEVREIVIEPWSSVRGV
jgi:hypothetical protein